MQMTGWMSSLVAVAALLLAAGEATAQGYPTKSIRLVAAPLVTGEFVVPATPGLGATLDRGLAAAHPWQPLQPAARIDERLG